MDVLRRDRTRAEFEGFVAGHADGLLRTGYLMTADLPEAEELVQECLLRVARRWPRVRSMDHPGAYARRILVNLALDGRPRRARRMQELGQDHDQVLRARANGDSHEDAALVRRSELLQALEELTPRQRAVLVLRYFEDLPETMVADLLGCSIGTVKSTCSRGLARLRATLEEAESEPCPEPHT